MISDTLTTLGIFFLDLFFFFLAFGVSSVLSGDTDGTDFSGSETLSLFNKLLIILPPFVILVYAFVAYIIVELISGILSGKRPEFINKLKDAADRFGNNLIKYCDNIFRLLGTLLKVLPDFLTCLSILLFEEEETARMFPSGG